MKETKELKMNNGITLIALIITIIVMLILVGVTISMAVNGGLFDYAGKAVSETNNTLKAEQQLADGGIEVDGVWYNSINEYVNRLEPGLYKPGSNYDVLLTAWDKLISDGIVRIENGVVFANVYDDVTGAGGCAGLEGELVLPSDGSVTEIGQSAFECCGELKGIIIPDSVTKIGDYAFSFTNLTKISIPDSVTYLGSYAFLSCENLETVNIPSGITKISDNTFEDCYRLSSIVIPDNITEIGRSAFDECGLERVTIPNNVEIIGWGAFNNCGRLTDIILGTGIQSLQGIFQGCSSLETITIPANVTTINGETFYGCTGLTNAIFENQNGWKAIRCL